jgi:hypothetical protein
MQKALIRLRAHHFVCLLSFQGKGYGDDFVVGVAEIVTRLRSDPLAKSICLAQGCDDVCAFCPKRNDKACEDEDRISKIDADFRNILNISDSSAFSFTEIQQIVAARLKIDDFKRICKKCRWFDICSSSYFASSGY